MGKDESTTVKATKTSFEIIDELKDRNGAGVTELATALDLSKSAVHKHLQTLINLGYVVKDGTEYHLGLKFLMLGQYTLERSLDEFGDIRSELENLAETTQSTTTLVVSEGMDGVVLYQTSATTQEEVPYQSGERFFLPETAAGVAILAHSPEQTVNSVTSQLDKEDQENLREETRRTRDRNLAFKQEQNNSLESVAAPLLKGNDESMGAISVTFPTDSIRGKRLDEDLAGLVLSAATSIRRQVLSASS